MHWVLVGRAEGEASLSYIWEFNLFWTGGGTVDPKPRTDEVGVCRSADLRALYATTVILEFQKRTSGSNMVGLGSRLRWDSGSGLSTWFMGS